MTRALRNCRRFEACRGSRPLSASPLAPAAAAAGGTLAYLDDRAILDWRNLSSILTRAAILGVLAVGPCCVILAGGFDLSQGATLGLACCRRRDGDGKGYDSVGCFAAALLRAASSGWSMVSVCRVWVRIRSWTTLSSLMVVRASRSWFWAG